MSRLEVDPGLEHYIPFAQRLLYGLKRFLGEVKQTQGRKNAFVGPVHVQVGTYYNPAIGWTDSIRISGPAITPRGFLIYRDGNGQFIPADYQFYAHYNDGVNEWIDPQTTDPVAENPNPANDTPLNPPEYAQRRSARYRIPFAFRETSFTGYNTASMYSGLMRRVVGSYHARGANVPFSYSWGTTHGIAHVNGSDGKDWYYVVEISRTGVYSAPIDSKDWSVTRYLATAEMVVANPWMEPYQSTLSLALAHAIFPDRGVVLHNTPDLGRAYNRAPWWPGHGWAFNYLGSECQHVVYRTRGPSEAGVATDHFATSRYRMRFYSSSVGDGRPALQCSMDTVEEDKPIIFYHGSVWIPVDTRGSWSSMAVIDPDTIPLYPEQDAPIFVFYNGNTEQVVRWSLTDKVAAEDLYNDRPSDADLTDVNGNHYGEFGYFTDYRKLVASGVFLNDFAQDEKLHEHKMMSPVFHHVYGTGRIYGFTATEFNGVFDNRAHTLEDDVGTEFGQVTTVTHGTENYSGLVVDLITTMVTQSIEHIRTTRVGSGSGRSSVVLMPFDRESVICVRDEQHSDTLSFTRWVRGPANYTSPLYKAEPEPGGRNQVHQVAYETDPEGVPQALSAYGSASLPGYIEGEYTAEAVMLLGSYIHKEDIASNVHLMPFLEFSNAPGFEKEVISPVFGMHGNLYHDDPKLDPPQQSQNRVIWLKESEPEIPSVRNLWGGFTPGGKNARRAFAFVGDA